MSIETATWLRSDVVRLARAWLGTPYHHQASYAGVGTDCLGLIRGAYRELHGFEAADVLGYSRDWAEASGRETMLNAARLHLREVALSAAEAGDILLFRWRANTVAKHVGILSDRDHLIHAFEDVAVTEIRMTSWWWRHAVAAFRFPGMVD